MRGPSAALHPLPEMPGASQEPPHPATGGCGELVLDPAASQARMPDTTALPPRAARSPHTGQQGAPRTPILTFSQKEKSGSRYRELPASRAPPCCAGWAAAAPEPALLTDLPVPSAPGRWGQSLSPCDTGR